jgi:hypothetical protein
MNVDVSDYDAHGILWLAVLHQAISDAASFTAEQSGARAWMVSESNAPGSLNWVCSMLNINPDDIRKGVQQRIKDRSEGHTFYRRPMISARFVSGPDKLKGDFRGNQTHNRHRQRRMETIGSVGFVKTA